MFKVPEYLNDQGEWMRQLSVAINQLIDGRSNAIGEVTLAANQDTTVINDLRVGADTRVFLMPITVNASASIDTTYVSSLGKQTFTLTHANNAQTDRVFKYAIIG